jgi:dTDP-4-dehydrorhamnose reductase
VSELDQHGKRSLLILGARGFLGERLAAAGRAGFHIIRADRTAGPGTDLVIDITDPVSVHAGFTATRPDAAVLLSAIADIDRCQREPDLAHAVNQQGALHVAQACAEHGVRLLFTSTGAVFDGTRDQYLEEDPTTPISVYGITKARAEELVLQTLPECVIVRASLVLGRSLRPNTNSLIEGLFRRWLAGETVFAPEDELRNPIDVSTLAAWMLRLLEDQNPGIYHAGSSDLLSRLAIARRIAQRSGIDLHLVQQAASPSPQRAPRGPRHFLISNKIGQACHTGVPSSEEVILRSLYESA